MLMGVFKVGGDIQMSMDINEAIKEDIQVHPTTSRILFYFYGSRKSHFRAFIFSGHRGKWG